MCHSINEWEPSASTGGSALFTFQLSEPHNTDLTIPFTVSGSATPGADYTGTLASGSLFIPAGELTPMYVSLTAAASPDALVEGDETIQVDIASTPDYNGASRTLTIRDNLAPTAADDTATVVHDRSVTIPLSDLLTNDSDPENHPLTLSLGSATNGTVALNSYGEVVFTPDPGFVTDTTTTPPTIAKFNYTVSDGAMTSNTATVTINVTNIAPVAQNDPINPANPNTPPYSVLHDNSITISVAELLANDTDADGDSLQFIFDSATDGTVNLNYHDNGTPSDTTDDFLDSIEFIPTPNYSGTASFAYIANDGIANSNTVTVAISVTNNVPLALPGFTDLPHSTALLTRRWTTPVLYSDGDSDNLTFTITPAPGKGTVVDNGNGTFTYTANVSEFGLDSFTINVTDGVSPLQTGIVSITLTDLPPVFENPDLIFELDEMEFADGDVIGTIIVSVPDGDPLSFSTTSPLLTLGIALSGAVLSDGRVAITVTALDSFKFWKAVLNNPTQTIDIFVTDSFLSSSSSFGSSASCSPARGARPGTPAPPWNMIPGYPTALPPVGQVKIIVGTENKHSFVVLLSSSGSSMIYRGGPSDEKIIDAKLRVIRGQFGDAGVESYSANMAFQVLAGTYDEGLADLSGAALINSINSADRAYDVRNNNSNCAATSFLRAFGVTPGAFPGSADSAGKLDSQVGWGQDAQGAP